LEPRDVPSALNPLYAGTATWYCSDGRDGSPGSTCTHGYGPSSLTAAIDRKDTEFRKGDTVRVRYGDKSVDVLIVDVCGCADARVIDLTIGAFQRLAPWGLGVIPVTLELVGGPKVTLPPTDSEETP
jgi:rare lipoprotein A (peptidoglycan hydrolase)